MNPHLAVLKFGGTSVASLEAIRHVAKAIQKVKSRGLYVVVVVSAMARTTDQLVAWVRELSPLKNDCDTDAVMATGEQVSAGLLALALKAQGIPARSWQAWQIPLYADGPHGCAELRLQQVPKLKESLARGEIAVISGFQGINSQEKWVTLGRGSSDTTAVMVAACLGASICIIYTDVDGVYTADPRILRECRKLKSLSYAQMGRFAASGAQVLHPEAVRRADELNIPLQVRSSFFPEQEGTDIVKKSKHEGNFIGITFVRHMVPCFSLFPDDVMMGVCHGLTGLAWSQAFFIQRRHEGWSWMMRKNDFQNWWQGCSGATVQYDDLHQPLACVTLVADISGEALRQWWIKNQPDIDIPYQGIEITQGNLSLLVQQKNLKKLGSRLHRLSGLSR